MNEIGKSINSIEEFRVCYEQELKEILDELDKNGVTNIEGVEEVIKLFFDEYYQYLSVELASNREIYELYQQTMYGLTEKRNYLGCFTSVISSEFYGEVYRKLDSEINELATFIPNYDNRYDFLTGSGAKKYTNEEYLDMEEDLQRRIEHDCSRKFRVWYLEKKTSRLHAMCRNLLELENTNKFKLAVGSIIYNGHLRKLEELLNVGDKCSARIIKFRNEIERLKSETTLDLNSASLDKITYELPIDLFAEFNSYIFNILCDGVYLKITDMSLERTGKYKTFTQKKREEIGTSKTKKIEKQDLEEYLNSSIEVKDFWKEKIIDDFLRICIEQLTGPGPDHIRLGISALFGKKTLEQMQNLRNMLLKSKKTIFSNEQSRIAELNIIRDLLNGGGGLNCFNRYFCVFYHPEIYSHLHDFNEAFNLQTIYRYHCANRRDFSEQEINKAKRDFEKFLKSNFKKIQNGVLRYLDNVENLRTELAIEIFGLTEEEVKQMSEDELEQKYQNLLKQEVEKLEQARKRLVNNKQEAMRSFIPQFILESSNEVDALKSNIGQLNRKLEEIQEKIIQLTNGTLSAEAPSVSFFKPQGDNSELQLYILNKLVNKYRPLIEPMIRENTKEREQTLLDSDKTMNLDTPFGLTSSYNNGIPVIGPSIPRKLGDGKK